MSKDSASEFRRTGGPAFPTHGYCEGMTVRAWFTGQALAGAATSFGLDAKALAVFCVAVADEMIARLRESAEVEKS